MKRTISLLILVLIFNNCGNTKQTGDTTNKLNLSTLSGTEYLYEPSISTLTGTITKVSFRGPPNYGDDSLNDIKEIYPVLLLPKPIDIKADSSNAFNVAKKGITQIQLLSNTKIDTVLNKEVIVRGKLFGAQTGHHHTEVLLIVSELNVSR